LETGGVDKIAALAYVAARTRRSAPLAAAFKEMRWLISISMSW
jgi:hypothetical protein